MGNSEAELLMKRLKVQSDLFSEKLSRLNLISCDLGSKNERLVKINVWRNHAIEPIISLSRPFFSYAGLIADFRLSDYDDTLMFTSRTDSDIELLWLDSNRYLDNTTYDRWLEWLDSRLRVLRASTTAPIIIASWLPEDSNRSKLLNLTMSLPGVYFADIGELCAEAKVVLIDKRTAEMAGTLLSNAAQLLVARKLVCHWLAAVKIPSIKAVALDLDNTLHLGVLGEEGTNGVRLTSEHASLQLFIRSLQELGIFIALVSRNERADVKELFVARKDYPLRWEDFTVTEISWDDKASAITRIADKLRIAPDAILFVDDNPGELASVTLRIPGVHIIHAVEEADQSEDKMIKNSR